MFREVENNIVPRVGNSIFLPAGEILSLQHLILRSREVDRTFGFDDTHYDLAQALGQPSGRREINRQFSQASKKLENLIGGHIALDEQRERWVFRNGNQRVSIGATAESMKKIGILDILLNNQYLDINSIIFIDEIETTLHPITISKLLEIIMLLASQGIQFFLTTHSSVVLKKLYLLSQIHNMSIPVLIGEDTTWTQHDLLDDIPNNSIMDEYIRLYEEEVDLALS